MAEIVCATCVSNTMLRLHPLQDAYSKSLCTQQDIIKTVHLKDTHRDEDATKYHMDSAWMVWDMLRVDMHVRLTCSLQSNETEIGSLNQCQTSQMQLSCCYSKTLKSVSNPTSI